MPIPCRITGEAFDDQFDDACMACERHVITLTNFFARQVLHRHRGDYGASVGVSSNSCMLSAGGGMSLFRVKPLDAILAETEQSPQSLKRVLGAGDLVMLAIGAVIGAGIFGSIGSAAAGQAGPRGGVLRLGTGPAARLR